jgi:hypothetical protein
MIGDNTRSRSIDRTLLLLISDVLVAIVTTFPFGTYQRIRICLTA